MPMKRRKYADGGIVVSRGADDTSRFRLFDDTPAAGIGTARAVAEMAAADEVGARPTMEELQAANLAAVRAREARETARPVRRQAPAAGAALSQQDRRQIRDIVSKPIDSSVTTKSTAKPDSDFASFRKRMIDNTPAMSRLPSDAEIKKAYENRGRTTTTRTVDRTPAYKKNIEARNERVAGRAQQASARDRALAAQMTDMESARRILNRERRFSRPLTDAEIREEARRLGANFKKGGPVKKADMMKKAAAKGDKKPMPIAAMMMMAVPAKGAKKPVKKAAGGAIKQVKGYAMGGKVGCGHKGMKKK